VASDGTVAQTRALMPYEDSVSQTSSQMNKVEIRDVGDSGHRKQIYISAQIRNNLINDAMANTADFNSVIMKLNQDLLVLWVTSYSAGKASNNALASFVYTSATAIPTIQAFFVSVLGVAPYSSTKTVVHIQLRPDTGHLYDKRAYLTTPATYKPYYELQDFDTIVLNEATDV
jgi:hypothetical protein